MAAKANTIVISREQFDALCRHLEHLEHAPSKPQITAANVKGSEGEHESDEFETFDFGTMEIVAEDDLDR